MFGLYILSHARLTLTLISGDWGEISSKLSKYAMTAYVVDMDTGEILWGQPPQKDPSKLY